MSGADLLRPNRVLVVGASNDVDSVGARFVRPLAEFGFGGEVFVVHPREKTVLGFPAVAHPADAPPADIAIIAVGAQRVVDAAGAAASAGAKFVHVFTGGFSETGTAEGAALEAELRQVVVGYGSRLIGPNCMGVHRPSHRWTFRHDLPLVEGAVGIVSQSGGVAIAAIRLASARGGGLSAALSLGNCADFDLADGIDVLAADSRTEEIAVYAESAGAGDLLDALRRASLLKPVRVWMAGTTSRAHAAAVLHTGAPGGPFRADIAASGATPVGSIEGLLFGDGSTSGERSSTGPTADGGLRVAALSISGGVSVILTGALERAGHQVPQLAGRATERIAALGGSLAGNVGNPIDLGGAYLSRGRIGEIISVILTDPSLDRLVFHLALDYVDEVDERHPGFVVGWLDAVATALEPYRSRCSALLWPVGVSTSEELARKRLGAAGIDVVDSIDDIVSFATSGGSSLTADS